MIKLYFLSFMAALLATANLQAQCGSCSTTISNANSANHLVNSGQTLCITATGTVSGAITVLAGGTVCNQGLINSTNVWIAGGTLINTGTINIHNITVSSAGSYTNEASFEADSFLVINPNARYINNGTQVNNAFAVADHAKAVNVGTITANLFYDSIANVVNNGNITILDGFANAHNSYFENNGNINVANDFANGYASTFFNNKNMSISRDFYNGQSSYFTTNCVVQVTRNWYNTASILGPVSSCGGFAIGGASSNTGAVGSASTFIDICDAGHPAGGFDANIGNVAASTTFCTCVNNCITVGIYEMTSTLSSLNVYPNPTSGAIKVHYTSTQQEATIVTVKDLMGRTLLTQTQQSFVGNNELEIPTDHFAGGTYLLSISDAKQMQANRLFTVVR